MASRYKGLSGEGKTSGKIDIFAIQFTADRCVYSPGGVVTGEVIMELKESTKIQDAKNKDTSSNDAVELREGVHAFGFEFTIPDKYVPFSYESRYGYVRYFITATIHKPWKHDHVTKRAFTVLGEPLDLNADPGAKTPVTIQKTRTPGILPSCVTGQVDFNVTLPRTVFCCGESININAKIDNQTKRRVEKTSAKLIQLTTYHATRGAKIISETVKVVDGEGIEPGESLEWTNAMLDIPALPPTELRHCTVIDIQYELQLTATHQQGLRSTTHVRIPLKIGNVPIVGSDPKSIDLSWTDEPSSKSSNTKVLSYGACVKGSRDIRDKNDTSYVMGHLSFTPTYIIHKDTGQDNTNTGNNDCEETTNNNQSNSVA